jgi:hypothetical protein
MRRTKHILIQLLNRGQQSTPFSERKQTFISVIMSNSEDINAEKIELVRNRRKDASEQKVFCPIPFCKSTKRKYDIPRTVRETYIHLANRHKIR